MASRQSTQVACSSRSRPKAERLASGDPRLSLEERYGDHAGYVETVREAAANAIAEGFLLPDDAEDLIARAEAATRAGRPARPTRQDIGTRDRAQPSQVGAPAVVEIEPGP